MKLFEKVRFWARYNSVRLALVAGSIVTGLASNPEQAAQIVQQLPEPVRPLLGIAVAAVAIWARVKPQSSLSKPDGQ